MNANGGRIKDVRLQWGEVPSSIGNHPVEYIHIICMWCRCVDTVCVCVCPALIGDSHVMGWGSKAIEIRAVESGQLDGVFMHKRTQKLRFLCERNDKVCVCVACVGLHNVYIFLFLSPSHLLSSPGLLCQHPHLLLQSGLLHGSQQKSGASVAVGLAGSASCNIIFCV